VDAKQPAPARRVLFADTPESELLGYGVPAEWLGDVRLVDEDSLLVLADRLPAEAAEALLELAVGGKPRVAKPVAPTADPFEHPDAQRRFRVMANLEELQRALEFPWEKWTVFLHPEQRQWVERDYAGPAKVTGSAGTGKTIVALHRAVHLARAHPDSRVLLTTFSDTLASSLQTKLRRLVGSEPRLGERIDVRSLESVGLRLHKALVGPVQLVDRAKVKELLAVASVQVSGHKFSLQFLLTEWEQVVDAWQLDSWDSYRDVARLGRMTRLPTAQREVLWAIFERVREALKERGLSTMAGAFTTLAAKLKASTHSPPFDFAVVDEAQDISVAGLRFLAALGVSRPDALFFAGDSGQRIFQQPFSWKSLGVDIRGRSRTLRINYRTSHQIRVQADRLLGPSLDDVDGNTEVRNDTVSVFNGPTPAVRVLSDEDEETHVVAAWLRDMSTAGLLPHECGVFVRSSEQIGRARRAVETAGLLGRVLDEHVETATGFVSICSMHLAKGLEFRAVAVMACDDEILPLQSRIETVGDDADLKEVYDTERQLFYVACTRARDHLLVTGAEPGSEFLDDLRAI
jgi:superfamily I DNA/RNA helicase